RPGAVMAHVHAAAGGCPDAAGGGHKTVHRDTSQARAAILPGDAAIVGDSHTLLRPTDEHRAIALEPGCEYEPWIQHGVQSVLARMPRDSAVDRATDATSVEADEQARIVECKAQNCFAWCVLRGTPGLTSIMREDDAPFCSRGECTVSTC